MTRSPARAGGAAPLVAALHRFSRADLQTAGGKAANLGELIRADFPVPPGFVVTTAAYDRFLADNGLHDIIARAPFDRPGDGEAIRQAFETASIPPDVERSLQAAYRRLARGPVAVRSSATAEDLPEAAFAGQQDTFLNVADPQSLSNAVRRCWASLWSERAIAYRRRQGVDHQAVKLAVVVQRMAAAEAAGVLFTANPVTGARARARALEARDPRGLAWEGLLATVREALELIMPLAGQIRRRYYPRTLLAAGTLRLALGLLGRGSRFGALLSGVESATLEANRALEKLAGRIRSDPVLAGAFALHVAGELPAALALQPAGRSFLVELRGFLDLYGHREVALSTALQPTWKDAPEVVLGILKGLASTQTRPRAERPAWQVAQEELLAHPLLRFPPLRSAVLGLLATARRLWQIREDTHFDLTLVLPTLRRTMLELGRRLAGSGALDSPEDVFHLTWDELERIGGAWPPPPALIEALRAAARRRKERRAALEGTPLVDPRLYRAADTGGDALLQGTAGSPGAAEGPVRVIRDASQFDRLRCGEVLVAPYTNPAWTPLFQRAAAVVVDSGAAGSHPSIVAREYGLPAVVGTAIGTQTLHDGEWVQVDGDRGVVRRARREET